MGCQAGGTDDQFMGMNKLARNSIIYSVSSIIVQAISLLLVPIFTKYMTAEQFGQYNLLITIQTLLAIFITLGVNSGLTRFIYECEDQNRVKNSVLTFAIIWGSLMCVLACAFGDSLYAFVFKDQIEGGFLINYLVISSVLLGLTSVYIAYYTMLVKPKIVSMINLSRVLIMVLLSAYFIIIRQAGVDGALLAQLYTYAVVFTGLILFNRKNLRVVLDWKELKPLLKYSFGFIPGQASTWVYTLIDRYFLNAIMGLRQVAVYSLGYRIGMLMEPVFIVPFKSVFTAFKYKVYREDDAAQKFREIYLYYNFIGLFCVLGFSVFAKPVILLLATAEYVEAFRFIPLIVFAYFLNGLNEFFSLGIHIENKSLISSFILLGGALSNVLLNILLIPRYGIMGAALATVISYFFMNLITYFIGKHYMDFGLRYWEPIKGYMLVLVIYSIYLLVNAYINNIFAEIAIAALLCLLYIIVSFIAGLIPRDAVRLGLAQIKKWRGTMVNEAE